MNTFISIDGFVEGMIVIFMFFLCMLCLFAVVVIVRDIVHENGETRRERRRDREERRKMEAVVAPAPVVVKVEEPKPEPTPKPEPVVEEVVEEVAEEPTVEVDENAVTFSKNNLTMEDKYAMLSSEHKGFFDSIVKHVNSKEGVKENKREGSYDYKIGSYKVLKIMIKRGEIVCEFMFIDRELIKYASTSGVKMKQSATVIKVIEPSGVGVVKDGIDMICDQIEDDKEYKRNLAREKRREKRRLQNQASVK